MSNEKFNPQKFRNTLEEFKKQLDAGKHKRFVEPDMILVFSIMYLAIRSFVEMSYPEYTFKETQEQIENEFSSERVKIIISDLIDDTIRRIDSDLQENIS